MDKLKNAPPWCTDLLESWAFSIGRSMKSFSRAAIDLTLEQTVNRKAAYPSQGLIPYHNNPDTIRRWWVSANQRHMSVGQMESMKNMEKIEKPSAQNTKWRIDKDNLDRKNVQDCIKSSCNPFDGPVVEAQNWSISQQEKHPLQRLKSSWHIFWGRVMLVGWSLKRNAAKTKQGFLSL